MTKSDLIERLCQLQKLPKGRAELLVNCIFQAMEDSLKRGERIEIRGFGSFEIRHYRAYEGRNPRTGSTVTVKPKRLPFFKVGKELKDRVNGGVSVDDDDDDDDLEHEDEAAEASSGNGHSNGAHGNGASNGASRTVAAPQAQPASAASSPAADGPSDDGGVGKAP